MTSRAGPVQPEGRASRAARRASQTTARGIGYNAVENKSTIAAMPVLIQETSSGIRRALIAPM
jgi:hypothetical protein